MHMTYIKRAAEETVLQVSKMFPVLLLTGPRQVGKTTLLQRLATEEKKEGIERKYVTLDDPDVRFGGADVFLDRLNPCNFCNRQANLFSQDSGSM